MLTKQDKRKKRVRSKLFGTAERPRLTVYRSNRKMFAQIIDDSKGKTLVSGSTVAKSKAPKAKQAQELGHDIAKKALAKKIKKVVFDRGSYSYHGRVQLLADAAREGGLEF